MASDLHMMTKDVAQHRKEIIERLVNFSLTDTLLFRNPEAAELVAEEEKIWNPIIEWVQQSMDTKFATSESLEVPLENNASLPHLQVFLESLSDKELAAFYQASKITKSVLLAAALVKKRVTAEEAFQAAFLEEIWQADKWGHEEEADRRREVIKKELEDVEVFLAA